MENMSEASSQYIVKPGERLQDYSYSESVWDVKFSTVLLLATILTGLQASDCLIPCLREENSEKQR